MRCGALENIVRITGDGGASTIKRSVKSTPMTQESMVFQSLRDQQFRWVATASVAPLLPPLRALGPPGTILSWKVRYRTILWFFSQMSKLYRARSPLYRRQILQENICWKALDEIYKICTAQTSIFQKIFVKLFAFFGKICKIRYFWILLIDFCSNFDEILSEFRR